MIKKFLIAVFCLALLLSACQPTVSKQTDAACYFYYPTVDASAGTLLPQPATTDPQQLSPEEFLSDYLEAPVPEGCRTVLPPDWKLEDFSVEGSTAQFLFGGTETLPVRRSLSLACLAKTLLQHPQIRKISILTPGSEHPTILTANDILLTDTGMQPPQEQITLYFPDAQQRYLIPETRNIDASQSANKPAFILQELLAEENHNCIPSGTKLLSITVENSVCTVDLSSEFEKDMTASFSTTRMAIYSIVNSLTELPEISTVDFWVAGAPLEQLNLMDLRQGVSRDERLFFSPTGEDYVDLSLYPSCSAGDLLVEIPIVLKHGEKEVLAEQIIQALIAMEETTGLNNCLPTGTKLLSVRMENTTCVLDFTGEFLAGCSNEADERLAVRSVIATVTSIEKISAVEILVEGIEPDFTDDTLGQLRRPQKDWFAP